MSEDQKNNSHEEQKDFDISSEKKVPEPDVILDVPKLKVGEIKLDVENLDAEISVKAQLANFVNIEVGTKVHIEKVKLEIKEVEAEAHLNVRLKRVENILLRTLKYLDENPDALKNLIPLDKINASNGQKSNTVGGKIQSAGESLGENKAGELVQKAGEKISKS
ncbi:hypothetical protein RCC89_17660 [Cytophagaceae bacterium ABcell3]|nr:hypothetical protein RCC89_17660 [Cytophagaceae bacterium ABcell3]